jgi:hypothetical protein
MPYPQIFLMGNIFATKQGDQLRKVVRFFLHSFEIFTPISWWNSICYIRNNRGWEMISTSFEGSE